MNKHAIVITCYKNFEHLVELVDYFDARFEIYIHLDLKSSIPQDLRKRICAKETVKLLESRYEINWGGRNHLLASLYLVSEALKTSTTTRLHFITGEDYPIKHVDELYDYFEKNDNWEYIEHFKLPSDRWKHGGLDRLIYHNFYDRFDVKKFGLLIHGVKWIEQRLGIKRSLPKEIETWYGGSTYWSLSRPALEYVMTFIGENPNFLPRMKHTFCVEEIFYQSILMNSPFKNQVVYDNLRYISWETKHGSNPAYLDLNDLSVLLESKNMFARKFHKEISVELRNALKNSVSAV